MAGVWTVDTARAERRDVALAADFDFDLDHGRVRDRRPRQAQAGPGRSRRTGRDGNGLDREARNGCDAAATRRQVRHAAAVELVGGGLPIVDAHVGFAQHQLGREIAADRRRHHLECLGLPAVAGAGQGHPVAGLEHAGAAPERRFEHALAAGAPTQDLEDALRLRAAGDHVEVITLVEAVAVGGLVRRRHARHQRDGLVALGRVAERAEHGVEQVLAALLAGPFDVGLGQHVVVVEGHDRGARDARQ